MNGEYKIRLHSTGPIFTDGLRTSDALKILYNFSEIYSYCLEKATSKFAKGEQFLVSPELKIEYVKNGSLSSLMFVDFPAAYAMLSPLIGSHSWELFKFSFELVKASISLIKRKNEVPNVKMEKSPKSVMLVAGRDIIVTPDILDVAKRKQDNITTLAESVSPAGVSVIDMKLMGKGDKVADRVRIDRESSPFYIMHPKEVVSDEESDLSCSIYKFNRKSMLGTLDTEIDGVTRSLNFEAVGGKVSDYLESMKLDSVLATARFKYQVNAFGETKVVYLYLTGVSSTT